MSPEREPAIAAEVALTFATISSTAFGGGQKASIRQQVLNRGWMDRDRFMDGLEIAQVLPGPNILNLALYCGQRVRGIPGAVAAFLGASIPPFASSWSPVRSTSNMRRIHSYTVRCVGCAAGALGLTLGNALELTWDERAEWIRIVLVAITAATVSFLHMPLLLVLVLFGGIGVAHEYLRSRTSPPARIRTMNGNGSDDPAFAVDLLAALGTGIWRRQRHHSTDARRCSNALPLADLGTVYAVLHHRQAGTGPTTIFAALVGYAATPGRPLIGAAAATSGCSFPRARSWLRSTRFGSDSRLRRGAL